MSILTTAGNLVHFTYTFKNEMTAHSKDKRLQMYINRCSKLLMYKYIQMTEEHRPRGYKTFFMLNSGEDTITRNVYDRRTDDEPTNLGT